MTLRERCRAQVQHTHGNLNRTGGQRSAGTLVVRLHQAGAVYDSGADPPATRLPLLANRLPLPASSTLDRQILLRRTTQTADLRLRPSHDRPTALTKRRARLSSFHAPLIQSPLVELARLRRMVLSCSSLDEPHISVGGRSIRTTFSRHCWSVHWYLTPVSVQHPSWSSNRVLTPSTNDEPDVTAPVFHLSVIAHLAIGRECRLV